MAAGFLFWPYNPDLVRRMAKVADRPLAAFDGAICMVPRRSALAKGRAAARGAGVFTAPMFSVIEYDNALELRPRVKTSGWPPAVVQVPLDLDPSEKWSERALCVESRCGAVAVGRTYL